MQYVPLLDRSRGSGQQMERQLPERGRHGVERSGGLLQQMETVYIKVIVCELAFIIGLLIAKL